MRIRAGKPIAIVVMVAVLATACGGVGLSAEQNELVVIAQSNMASLQLTSDLASTQMLDSRTGQITDLSEVVTGDRPVLMWYWAPN